MDPSLLRGPIELTNDTKLHFQCFGNLWFDTFEQGYENTKSFLYVIARLNRSKPGQIVQLLKSVVYRFRLRDRNGLNVSMDSIMKRNRYANYAVVISSQLLWSFDVPVPSDIEKMVQIVFSSR